MAYKTIKIPVRACWADASAGAGYELVTGTHIDYPVWHFDPDTIESVYFNAQVPANYQSGGHKIRIRWTTTATAGLVKWIVTAAPKRTGIAYDAAFGGSNSNSSAVPGVAGVVAEIEFDLSAVQIEAGDIILVRIDRGGTDAVNDTCLADANLIDIDWFVNTPDPMVLPVRLKTTANVANLATGAPNPVDGVVPGVNTLVLVGNEQATGAQRGIYRVQSPGAGADGVWLRAAELDTDDEAVSGLLVHVSEGTANGGKYFRLATANPIVVGATTMDWQEFGGGGTDTYTIPSEWHVSTDEADDATLRTFDTLAEALADGDAVLGAGETLVVRMKGDQSHAWDGSNMPTGRNVVIYAVEPEALLFFSNNTTISEDVNLTLQSLSLLTGTNVSISLFELNITDCSGVMVIEVADPPTAATGKVITLRDCDDISLEVTTADTSGDGSINVYRSHLSCTGSLIDNTAALTNWAVQILDGCVVEIETAAALIFLNCDLGEFGSNFATIKDSTFIVASTAAGALQLSTFNTTWHGSKVRILDTTNPTTFGAAHFQFGLVIENVPDPDGLGAASWPATAELVPDGTIGLGSYHSGPLIWSTSLDELQWRGAGNTIRLKEQTTNAAPTNTLTSPFDGTSAVGSRAAADTKFVLRGHVTANRTGASALGAYFPVELFVRRTAAAAYTILSGDVTPAPTYEDPIGEYIVTLTVAAGLGIQVDVDQNAAGGNTDWVAFLQVVEII